MFRNASYIIKPVHTWAVNMCILVICGILNIFGVRIMDHLHIFSLLWFIGGFFIWLIVPIARSPTHASAKEVFTGGKHFGDAADRRIQHVWVEQFHRFHDRSCWTYGWLRYSGRCHSSRRGDQPSCY